MTSDEQKARSRHFSSRHSFTVVYMDNGRFALLVRGRLGTVKIGAMAEIAEYIEQQCNPLYGLGL